MKIFATDLDNTLIYSYKRDIGKDKVLVETKEGKELSFMSSNSHKLLKKMEFIPVTTRSLEQYRRIEFFKGYQPEYALVANGGILLHCGKIDDSWYLDSLKMAESAFPEMDRGMEILKEDRDICFEIRRVDGLFIFTKSRSIEKTIKNLKEKLKPELVDIHNHGEKLYIFPKTLNKGVSLERLRELLKPQSIICAGDSEMDIPMLERADISIFPEGLESFITKKEGRYAVSEQHLFSDKVLELAERFLKMGTLSSCPL